MPERITLKTVDGVPVIGTWLEAPKPSGAVLLLHMMPLNRSSWADVQNTFAEKGLSSLAIDMRGHGESTVGAKGERLNYHEFTDEQHQDCGYDIEASIEWMRKKNYELGRMALMGSSIGAALALIALVDEPRIPVGVLVSPGDYRGIRLVEESRHLNYEQSLCILASADDQQSYAISKRLAEEAPIEKREFLEYTDAGHGNAILEKEVALPGLIADWILLSLR